MNKETGVERFQTTRQNLRCTVALYLCANYKMYLCKLQKCICSNCKIYLFKQQGRIHEIPLHYIFVQITKMYLCKLQKCICSNCKIYLFKQRGRIHEIPLSNQCRSPGVSRPCTCELEWQPSHKLRCPRPFSFYKRC